MRRCFGCSDSLFRRGKDGSAAPDEACGASPTRKTPCGQWFETYSEPVESFCDEDKARSSWLVAVSTLLRGWPTRYLLNLKG